MRLSSVSPSWGPTAVSSLLQPGPVGCSIRPNMDTSLAGNTGTTLGLCISPKSESEVAQSCRLCGTPWTVACQAPPSMGFSRQECWSGVPFPSPGESSRPRDLTQISRIVHCGQILYCLSHQGSASHPLNLPESFCCPRTLRPSPPALKGPSTRPHCLATNLFLCATDVIPHSVMGQKPHGLSFMVVAIRERRGKKILN